MSSEESRSRLAVVFAAVVASALVLGAVAPAPAGAIDSATLLYFDSEGFNDDTTEIDAEPGETLTLEVVASTHGNPAGEGIVGLSYAVEYDPDVLTVTDVEHGPMLAAGDAGEDGNVTVDGTADIDDENGVVTVDQERRPPGDGSTGTETTVTLTVEVAEDAPATSETLEITDRSAAYPSDYSVTPTERDATIVVDGGESDDSDSGDDTDDAAAGSDSGGADTVPGFTPLAAVVALATALRFRSRR